MNTSNMFRLLLVVVAVAAIATDAAVVSCDSEQQFPCGQGCCWMGRSFCFRSTECRLCPKATDLSCDGLTCVDTMTDAANCGGCRNKCAAGETCCGGSCYNLSTNTDNCGRCGYNCQPSQRCCGGKCIDGAVPC